MTISAILFDFVGVLLQADASVQVSTMVEDIDRQVGRVVDDRLFREEILRAYTLSDTQFEAVIRQIVGRYKPYEPLWELLPALRRRFKLGVVNNGTWWTFPYFEERLRIGARFDAFVSSAREGVRKPDARLYWRACEQLLVQPVDCLFMDDSQANVDAAQALGMQTVWWRTHTEGFAHFAAWLEQGLVNDRSFDL